MRCLSETVLFSAEGVQQGGPLGPLLFCLAIHSLVLQLKSELKTIYQDDGTPGGTEAEALQDFQRIGQEAALMELHLNHHKTELICKESGGQLLQVAPDLHKVHPKEAVLLGSPIGDYFN